MHETSNWVEDKERLKDLAMNFYSTLFSSEVMTRAEFITSHFPSASLDLQRSLITEYTNEDIKAALWQMGLWKAPGPDGF